LALDRRARPVDNSAQPVKTVLLDAEAVPDIDSTGAQVILELMDSLQDRGVGLAMARVRTELLDDLATSGIQERLIGGSPYLEVNDGVAAFTLQDADGVDGAE
jgi:SulP family sulfate permease